jgi:hypothetical protein
MVEKCQKSENLVVLILICCILNAVFHLNYPRIFFDAGDKNSFKITEEK